MRTALLLKSIRAGALSLLLALLWITGFKVISDLQRPEHRGLLVLDILEEQVRSARSGLDQQELFRGVVAETVLRPDHELLRRWMVVQALSGTPAEARQRLDSLVRSRQLTSELNNSVERWRAALRAWEESTLLTRSSLDLEAILNEARTRLHEAEGFRRIGRGYDATVYYVWSLQLLRKFLDREDSRTENKRTPEALLYAGLAWARIGEALPEGIRFERILHMVSELFPDTVWGIRANEQWSVKEVRKGV